MEIIDSILTQVGVTVNRSANQEKFLYELCDNNFNRLISLEEAMKKNHIYYIPDTSEDVSRIIKYGKDDRYFYMRAIRHPAEYNKIIVRRKDFIRSIPLAVIHQKGSRGYCYSVEISQLDGTWKKEFRYHPTRIPLNHWSLVDCEGTRRNARSEETNRIDRLYFDEYNDDKTKFEYEMNYDSSKVRKPGLEIHIIEGDIYLPTTNNYATTRLPNNRQ